MTSERYETILLERDDDGIALCTFNRPEVRNALDLAMVAEIRHLLRALAVDEDVRALIFTGAGEKAFMGGADVVELRDRKAEDALKGINSTLMREIEDFPAPTIAAIRGYALGGGLELAMACDLRVCSHQAKLGQPEVGVGIIPGAGGTYRMPRLIGLGRAKELIYTGRVIDAAEAHSAGLVNRVVPDDTVVDAARDLARQIVRNSPLALRLAKRALNTVFEATDAHLGLESALQAVLFEDPEKEKRMAAFLERRNSRKGGPR
jgi:enoyl-CoA hydratase